MKPFFRTAEARGGVCEIAQSLRGGEYSSAGNCTFFLILSSSDFVAIREAVTIPDLTICFFKLF